MNKKTFLQLISERKPEEINEFLKEKGKFKLRDMIGIISKNNKPSK